MKLFLIGRTQLTPTEFSRAFVAKIPCLTRSRAKQDGAGTGFLDRECESGPIWAEARVAIAEVGHLWRDLSGRMARHVFVILP